MALQQQGCIARSQGVGVVELDPEHIILADHGDGTVTPFPNLQDLLSVARIYVNDSEARIGEDCREQSHSQQGNESEVTTRPQRADSNDDRQFQEPLCPKRISGPRGPRAPDPPTSSEPKEEDCQGRGGRMGRDSEQTTQFLQPQDLVDQGGRTREKEQAQEHGHPRTPERSRIANLQVWPRHDASLPSHGREAICSRHL